MLSVFIGLLIFVISYGASAARDPTVFINIGITIPVVVLVAFESHEQLEVVVFDRMVTLMLGALVGLAVSIALWPVRALDELRRSVRHAFVLARETLDARFEVLISGRAQGPDTLAPERVSAQRMINYMRLLGQARAERRRGEDLSPRYLRAIGLAESLLGAGRSLRLSHGASMADAPEALRTALARAQKALEETFTAHERGLVDDGPWPPSTASLDDAIANMNQVLDEQWNSGAEGGTIAVRFSSLVEGLREIRRDLAGLVEEITILRKLRSGESVEPGTPSDWTATQAGWAALVSINPDRVKIALKGAVAGLAGFYVSEGLDVFTVLAMVFAIMVASAGTTASARLAAVVIFVGVSLGIGLAWLCTIFLTPRLEAVEMLARLPGLTVICALVFSGVGYLMGGRRLAPLALFMGIFFGVLFITGQTKVTTLDSHWSFLVSIWIAVLVGVVVNHLVWPMSAVGKLRRELSGSLDAAARIEHAAQTADSDPDAFHAEGQRFAARHYKSIEVQLKLVVAAEAEKAFTQAQVAHALGFQQQLFDVGYALARLRTRAPTAIDPLMADAQHALSNATAAYMTALAAHVRSPGELLVLPDLRSVMGDLIEKWKTLRNQESGATAFSAEDVRIFRTKIERSVLLVESLTEFADWLVAQSTPSSHATVMAAGQR